MAMESCKGWLHRKPMGCCTRGRQAFGSLVLDSRFTCKTTYFSSEAEGIRTPDLRRAKSVRQQAFVGFH